MTSELLPPARITLDYPGISPSVGSLAQAGPPFRWGARSIWLCYSALCGASVDASHLVHPTPPATLLDFIHSLTIHSFIHSTNMIPSITGEGTESSRLQLNTVDGVRGREIEQAGP